MKRTLSLAAALAAATPLAGQELAPITLDLVLDRPWELSAPAPTLTWVPGTRRISTASGDRITVRDALARDTTTFTQQQVAKAIRAANADKPPVVEGLPAHRWLDAERLRLVHDGVIYHWKVGEERAHVVLREPAKSKRQAVAAGDRIGAFVVDHDIVVVKTDGSRRRITWDGSADMVYGDAAHRAEFGIHDGLWWDAKGQRLAFYREDQRPIAKYPYADYSVVPPTAKHGRYPMAGRKHSRVTVGVYDGRDDSVRFLEADADADLYWTNVTFSPDGRSLFVAMVNRGQDHMSLVRFETDTGKRAQVMFTESDAEWIEPEHGPIFVPNGDGDFLWFSPRSGYRHLYRYDAEGKLRHQLTNGAFDIREFKGFAADGKHCFVMASGDNPLEMHLWSVTLDGGELRRLTTERGWHDCELGADASLAIDKTSNVDTPPSTGIVSLRRARTVYSMRSVDPRQTLLLPKQRFFQVKADDDTVLHGHLMLPPDFDPAGRYPVLHYVYGGPHSQLVRDTWLGGASGWLVHMACAGFVVCRLDNRGTDNRGIEFSQVVHRKLAELEVADQLRAIDYLKRQPWVDAARIGVHGWSYGGYMTLSLLLRSPEGTFACGASGAPVTDWAQYETGYTERYMDTPAENPDGYMQSSVVPRAGKLAGRLLLIHGTDDHTVMLSHSIAFLDACIDAGAMPECMLYPMQKHGLRGGDRKHLFRLLTRWFARELGR